MSKTVKLLKSDNGKMQEIVRLLTDFDIKTGRHLKYPDLHRHYERCAIAHCPTDSLTFVITEMENQQYTYIVQATSNDTQSKDYVKTEWIYEDGIKMERREENKEHPVHRIVCLTDMFEQGEPVLV